MTTNVTGQTFQHRDRLKELGGRWNSDNKCWTFDYTNASTIEALKRLPGCHVSSPETPKKTFEFTRYEPDDDESDNDDIVHDAGDDKPHYANRTSAMYGDDERWFNYFKDKNPMAFFGFSSINEFVKFVEAIPQNKRIGARDSGWKISSGNWAGTQNMSQAIDLARNGWLEGVEKAVQVVEFLNLEHATARRRAHNVAGGNVNVGRMLAGNPKHMVNRPKQPGRRVVTLFVENTASSSIKASNLTVRAAVVAAIADILERNGYSCEIVSITMQSQSYRTGNSAAQTAVTLKQAGEKLNLDDLVFALGHPSFLRRFNFAAVSQADECERIYHNQGYPTQAFNSYYPCGRNEFYVKYLKRNVEENSLEIMAKEIAALIIPKNLPVEIG